MQSLSERDTCLAKARMLTSLLFDVVLSDCQRVGKNHRNDVELTAIGFEKVLIASEVNLSASDMLYVLEEH